MGLIDKRIVCTFTVCPVLQVETVLDETMSLTFSSLCFSLFFFWQQATCSYSYTTWGEGLYFIYSDVIYISSQNRLKLWGCCNVEGVGTGKCNAGHDQQVSDHCVLHLVDESAHSRCRPVSICPDLWTPLFDSSQAFVLVSFLLLIRFKPQKSSAGQEAQNEL